MGLKPASKVQWGQQGYNFTSGTVAATAKAMGLYAAPWQEVHQPVPLESLNGDLIKYHGVSADLHRQFEINGWDATLTFEDAPFYFRAGYQGAVAGVSDGGSASPTYVYTFTPSTASTALPTFYSLEVGDDTQAHRANGCFFTDLEVSFAVRDRTHIKGNVRGRYLDANTGFSAGTAGNDRSVEEALGQNWTMYVEDTGSAGTAGTIGSTQYSGCIVQGSWKAMRYALHDCVNGTNLPGTVYPMPFAPELQVTVEVDSVAYSALRAAYTGQTQQLIRLQNLGGTVHSGTPSATKQKAIIIDGAYRITNFGAIGGSDQDGVQTVQVTATGEYNATYGKVSEVTVRNALSGVA